MSSSNADWKLLQWKRYLARKEDFSLHVFSQDVVCLPTSSRFHEAVGHLGPHVFAPVGDKIMKRLRDLLKEKHRYYKTD